MFKLIKPLPLCFAFLCIYFWSCSPAPKKDTPPPAESEYHSGTSPYPPLGNQELTLLYSITDKVDMIFYNLPMSLNQDEASSAKKTVLYVSPTPALMSAPCKALGRLSWISKGVIVKEADIYNDVGCAYFIFMKDNKPVASNAMSESGIEFFNQIIKQVQEKQK